MGAVGHGAPLRSGIRHRCRARARLARGPRAGYAGRPSRGTALAEDLHETDFYTWTQRQAEHLRAGRLDRADLANIAEEIESLGRSEASALRSAYRLVAMHVLKLMFQPDKAMQSRRTTIVRERVNAAECLDENPGLKPRRADLFARAYAGARKEAASETGLPLARFPVSPPFTVDEAEAEDFWPAPAP